MIIKRLLGITAAVTLMFTTMTPAHASATSEESNDEDAFVHLRVTDLDTGEVVYEDSSFQNIDTDGNISASVSSEDMPLGISPLDVEGGTKTGTITSTLNIQYSPRPGEEVRLEKVYGDWSSQAGIELSNREVGYNSGEPAGALVEHKYPTTNSFSYTTGWGYRTHYPKTEASGPRAYSSIDYQMSGSLESVRQELFVNLPNPK